MSDCRLKPQQKRRQRQLELLSRLLRQPLPQMKAGLLKLRSSWPKKKLGSRKLSPSSQHCRSFPVLCCQLSPAVNCAACFVKIECYIASVVLAWISTASNCAFAGANAAAVTAAQLKIPNYTILRYCASDGAI